MKTPTSLADIFKPDAARWQDEFRDHCARSNHIEAIIADCAQAVEYARSEGGAKLAKAKLRLQMALAERRQRNREAVRAA